MKGLASMLEPRPAPSAFFRALDGLNARDERVCDAADDAADADDWAADEWWADR